MDVTDGTISYTNIQNSSFLSGVTDTPRPLKRRKVLLLGGANVGKTALITRFIDKVFLDYYEPTLQSSQKKTISFHKESTELEIIDIDGCSEYTVFSYNKFARGFHGYLLVYNVTNKSSFELIKVINEKLNSLVGSNVPKILIGTHSDLKENREVDYVDGKMLAKRIGCPFIEVSSKEEEEVNNQIKKAFLMLILEINKKDSNFNEDSINCLNTYLCFIHHKKCLRVFYYILMVINILCGIGLITFCIIFPNVYYNYLIIVGL